MSTLSTGPSLPGNAVIAQSGGPTAVINQSLVGCIEALREFSDIGRIYGARHAVAGMVADDFVDLTETPDRTLARVAATPSSALGTSRDKPDEAYCERIFERLAAREIRHFFYIGGNDSSDTCRIVSEVARARGYELRAFHIPKTIDNDLVKNDHTPGFGSAARFVACALMGDSLDNAALPGIKIDVIMGRHAGFLTAASLLARTPAGSGPHLIYVPEATFDLDRFVADVDRIYTREGRCVIAVSEGIHDESGTPIAARIAEQLTGEIEVDAHGNVQLSGSGALGDHLANLIKSRLGKKLRVRSDTFGYLQRSFAGCVSPSDATEAREAGRAAGRAAADGLLEASITIERTSSDPYSVAYTPVRLSEVARKTRTLEPKYIVDGCDIAEEFRGYLAPLVGDLPVVEGL
jgi:6-phosphofructokinase